MRETWTFISIGNNPTYMHNPLVFKSSLSQSQPVVRITEPLVQMCVVRRHTRDGLRLLLAHLCGLTRPCFSQTARALNNNTAGGRRGHGSAHNTVWLACNLGFETFLQRIQIMCHRWLSWKWFEWDHECFCISSAYRKKFQTHLQDYSKTSSASDPPIARVIDGVGLIP